MDERMYTARQYFLGKMDEYADKSGNLREIAGIIGKELYDKCREYYHGEYSQYERMAQDIQDYMDTDGINDDILTQFGLTDYDAQAKTYKGRTLEELKEAAEAAYKFYRERN